MQDIIDPPRISRTPGVGIVNRQQLEMLGVLGVAVLGTLPETAFSPRNEKCLSFTPLYTGMKRNKLIQVII